MSNKRKIIMLFFGIIMILGVCNYNRDVYAETSQAEITTLDEQKDLVVMFTFDEEVVDIVFISPSGERKKSGDSDVEYSSGDLWSTYRITDAEAGTWSVEYDLKGNSEINCSIIEDDYGLWIQYLNINSITENSVVIEFEADCDTDNLSYNFEVYAVSTDDSSFTCKIADGRANSNEKTEKEVSLEYLASGSYIFRLEVYCTDGDGELFDSFLSDEIEYNNPNEESSIENFVTLIDIGNTLCIVDWSDYTVGGSAGYRLCVYEDDELIYSADLENNETSNEILFSADAEKLKVQLYSKNNDVWGIPKEKTIDLQEEYLKLSSDDVTGDGQVIFEYLTVSDRQLYVMINDDEGEYKLTDSGEISFTLTEGTNTVYAEMECDDLIRFIIDSQIYYDANPPEIKLYDDIDGKTFYTDSVDIIGKVSGCNKLTINGEEVTVDDNGEFNYSVELILGDNIVEIEAWDVNGNASKMVLTLYKASEILSSENIKDGLKQFLPLGATLLISIWIIIMACLFMKKTDRNGIVKKHRVWPFILWDIVLLLADAICIWQFIVHYIYCNSMDYLEMAEQSVSNAAMYLKAEKLFGIASCAGIVLLAISIILTVLYKKSLNKKNRGM